MKNESDISKKLRIGAYSQTLLNLEMYYGNPLKAMKVMPHIVSSRKILSAYEKYGQGEAYLSTIKLISPVLDQLEELKEGLWGRIRYERKDENKKHILIEIQNIYDCLSYVYWECDIHLNELTNQRNERNPEGAQIQEKSSTFSQRPIKFIK